MRDDIEHYQASREEAMRQLNSTVREMGANEDMMAVVITLKPEDEGMVDFNVMCLNIEHTDAIRALFQAIATMSKQKEQQGDEPFVQ